MALSPASIARPLMRRATPSRRDTAVAALVYATAAALLFHNLFPVIGTRIYADPGDPLLNTAILAWNAAHVPLSSEWWNFPSFAPLSGITAWTEHLLGAYPLTSPIIWASGNAVLAYNVLLLACFLLNGLCTFLLVREVTGSFVGGLAGGFAFAFAPYQGVQLSHIQTLMGFGMPLALFGLHRFIRTHTRSALVWFAAGWLSVLLSNAYLLVFFPILLGLWCVWFMRGASWSTWVAVVVVAAVAALPAMPLLWGYEIRQAAYAFQRSYPEIKNMSADIAGLIGISHRAIAWKHLLPITFWEGSIFPGLSIFALAVLGAVNCMRAGTPSRWTSRLVFCALLCTAIVAARIWTGPSGWRLGSVPLPALSPFRGVTLAVVLLILAIGTSGRMRSAWSRRDGVVFYCVGAVTMWITALGPEPAWMGIHALAYGPYWLLLHLPGVQSIRVPARAFVPAALCLAVCAGAGASRLIARLGQPWLIAPVAIAILCEGWFVEGTSLAPTSVVSGAIPKGAIALDLPIHAGYENADAQYLAVLGGYRVVNGYSGYLPPHYPGLLRLLAEHRREAFDAYRRLGDLYVIVRPEMDGSFVSWMESQDDIEQLARRERWRAYRLPMLGAGPARDIPIALPRTTATGRDEFRVAE